MAVKFERDALQSWHLISESMPEKTGDYLFSVQRTIKKLKKLGKSKNESTVRLVRQGRLSGSGFIDLAFMPADCEQRPTDEGFLEYDSKDYVDLVVAWAEMPMPYGCSSMEDYYSGEWQMLGDEL